MKLPPHFIQLLVFHTTLAYNLNKTLTTGLNSKDNVKVILWISETYIVQYNIMMAHYTICPEICLQVIEHILIYSN